MCKKTIDINNESKKVCEATRENVFCAFRIIIIYRKVARAAPQSYRAMMKSLHRYNIICARSIRICRYIGYKYTAISDVRHLKIARAAHTASSIKGAKFIGLYLDLRAILARAMKIIGFLVTRYSRIGRMQCEMYKLFA